MGFAEGDSNDNDSVIEVLSCNMDTVEWFMDLTPDFVRRETQKPKKTVLLPPDKNTILTSAKLLKLDFDRTQYQNLKLMINTAVTEYR